MSDPIKITDYYALVKYYVDRLIEIGHALEKMRHEPQFGVVLHRNYELRARLQKEAEEIRLYFCNNTIPKS